MFTADEATRRKLVKKGIQLNDEIVTCNQNHPYMLDIVKGIEKPSTKLWISNVLILIPNKKIEKTLDQLGVQTRSKIMNEKI